MRLTTQLRFLSFLTLKGGCYLLILERGRRVGKRGREGRREKGRKGGRGEKDPSTDRPDLGSNLQPPFGVWDDSQSIEPPGQAQISSALQSVITNLMYFIGKSKEGC